MNPRSFRAVFIGLILLIILATVCVYAAPPHQPPPPPPTPAQIPVPPSPQPTPAPPSPPNPVPPIVQPADSSNSPALPTVPTSGPTPASLPPPPPGVVVIPTLPTINPTTAPINDNSGSDSSNVPVPSSTNVPLTSQPTANPTTLQTLVIPTNPVAPGQTQTSPTQGASAGPAAGGGGGFSRLVEPVETAIVPPEQSGVVVGEPEQGILPAEQDSLKSSQVEVPYSGKDTMSEVASTTSTTDSSYIISTLRTTARNASAVTPASKIFPPMAVPAVAVTLGMAVALIGNILWANLDKIFSTKIFHFIREFIGENLLQRVEEYEAKKRKVTIRDAKKTRFGLTHNEILVAIAGAVLIGFASLVALHEEFAINSMVLYIATGGVAITVHEMGHRFAAHHQEVQTEVKFWELGAVIMFFTGWFAGSVFAQPHRTIMEDLEEPNHPAEAKISLAGPMVSICLALVTVPFLFVGGDVTKIASVLLMMTLLIAVYHLMPFEPMDGKTVYHWNRTILVGILVPLMVVYYFLFLM